MVLALPVFHFKRLSARTPNMKKIAPVFASTLLALSLSNHALAQSSLVPAPQNVLQLQASGSVEVQQDLLILTLGTTLEGKDATGVQTQLKQALDAALKQVREAPGAQSMQVRTGTFSLSPRYGDNRAIAGWQGRAELVLQGGDFPGITAAAARVSTMSISRIAFDLSRAQREVVEQEAQKSAIAKFKQQAEQLSKEFGFASYQLREVAINSHSSGPGPMPRMAAMQAPVGASSAPVPVEAGKAEVTVNVSGSIQMQ